MKRSVIGVATAATVMAGALVLPTPASATSVGTPSVQAAESTVTAPATATVGKPVTLTSQFTARNVKGKCFSPQVSWGDEDSNGGSVGVGICMNNQGGTAFSKQKDTFTHTYDRPGRYTVKVSASYFGGSSMNGPTGNKVSANLVKGARVVTRTITVTSPDQAVVSDARKAEILVDGARFTTREQIVELVNALQWPQVWTTSLGLDSKDSPPRFVDYYVVDGVPFVVSRATMSNGQGMSQVFTNDGSVRFYGSIPYRGGALFNTGVVAGDPRIVAGGSGWTDSKTGAPVKAWLWAGTNSALATAPR